MKYALLLALCLSATHAFAGGDLFERAKRNKLSRESSSERQDALKQAIAQISDGKIGRPIQVKFVRRLTEGYAIRDFYSFSGRTKDGFLCRGKFHLTYTYLVETLSYRGGDYSGQCAKPDASDYFEFNEHFRSVWDVRSVWDR